MAAPDSFRSLRSRWHPELRQHAPQNATTLLVGLRSDLRQDASVLLELASKNQQPVSEEEALRLAKDIQAEAYLECSALTQQDLKEVFDTAIWIAIKVQEAAAATAAGSGSGSSSSSRRKKLSAKVSDKRLMVTPTSSSDSADKKGGKGWKKLLCVSSHTAS